LADYKIAVVPLDGVGKQLIPLGMRVLYNVNPQNYYKYVRFKCRYMLHSLQFCVILS
jgi:isocitrate/isopropylmalate dehydrogenase